MTNQLPSIIKTLSTVLSVLSPIVQAAAPGAAVAVAIGQKIIAGVLAAEPTAVALYNQIMGGTPPSAAQLQQFIDENDAANMKTDADIDAALALLP